jgi:hypothetical protein
VATSPDPASLTGVQRVLDLDLDFFVRDVAHSRPREAGRLDPDDYPPWSIEESLAFLTERCGLAGPLPGIAVEHHRDVFFRWRDAIDAGTLTPPFHVTHVDGHADLGQGELGFVYLLTEVLFWAPEARRNPHTGDGALSDGNYLTFAIACRWLSDLVFVFNEGRIEDIPHYLMDGFDAGAAHLRMPAINYEDLNERMVVTDCPVEHFEPRVPFTALPFEEFETQEPFDFVSLARSPSYTPVGADSIYEAICRELIRDAA